MTRTGTFSAMTSPQYDPYQPPNQPDPTLPATDPASWSVPPASPAPPGSPAPTYPMPPNYAAPQPGYPTAQPGYPQPGYPQPGYPQPGYPQPGYPQPGYGYVPSPPTNTMAILSLVMAFVFSPLGIVFGYMARRQIAQNGEGGSGLATAGLILGYVFTAFYVLGCGIWIFAIVALGTASNNY
jgi:hypothetical protein